MPFRVVLDARNNEMVDLNAVTVTNDGDFMVDGWYVTDISVHGTGFVGIDFKKGDGRYSTRTTGVTKRVDDCKEFLAKVEQFTKRKINTPDYFSIWSHRF